MRAVSAAQQVSTVVRDKDPAPCGPLLASLAVLARRVQEADARLWRRISSDLVVFVNSVAMEVNQRVQGTGLSPAEYDDLRLKTFAWDVLVDLVEFAHRAELPPSGLKLDSDVKKLATKDR